MREVGRILLLKMSRHPEECNDEGSSKVFEWGKHPPDCSPISACIAREQAIDGSYITLSNGRSDAAP